MKENLKTLSLIVIALSVFAIAVIDILKLTMPRDTETDEIPFPKNFIDRKNAPGPLQNAATENPATNQLLTDTTLTTIEFPEEIFNFGNIHEGDKVKHDFRFINTGKNPLVIRGAKASCGCTIPSFNKEPIMPGKEGVISVLFNSLGKGGEQHKSIHVTANTIPNYTIIEITANVLDKK
ncbi:MAG: DUF1573 domain-containing protein [Bacteroidota bacterium]